MNRARVLFGSVVTVLGALFMLDYADVLNAGEVVDDLVAGGHRGCRFDGFVGESAALDDAAGRDGRRRWFCF